MANGKLFGARAYFDVDTDGEDMRWCVLVRGNRFTGSWSSGPEGGPVLGGAGAGARFYKITGQRVGISGKTGTEKALN
jgi:hypothetical protein